MEDNILVIHPQDNVAVALRTLAAGEQATGKGIAGFPALEEIPASHKIALRDIGAGEEIIKYGETIAVKSSSALLVREKKLLASAQSGIPAPLSSRQIAKLLSKMESESFESVICSFLSPHGPP